MLVSGAARKPLVQGFQASADAVVSYDGARVLFAGKRDAASHWQIWETAIEAPAPRQITSGDSDCIRPLYIPDGRVAYTRLSAAGSAVEIIPLAGGQGASKAERLTYAPGWFLTDDVLRDSRILLEYSPAGQTRELYTVYPDGTGVEAMRCDHGPDRSGARQVSSGDVIFRAGARLARFTPALAAQTDVPQPKGEPAGPIAELSGGRWIVPLRPASGSSFHLELWDAAAGQGRELEAARGVNAVEPVVVSPRVPPREFPSALVTTRTAGNLLCLNARQSKTPIAGSPAAVRVYTRGPQGQSIPLGQAGVERDGSFYVQVPADAPIRMEILDGSGGVIRGERTWFWMRASEQRICVGCHAGPERSPENKVPEVLLHSTVPVKMLGDAGRSQ